MKTVLTIAGSDCSGGAGIQADLKTIAAHKLYGMSAVTALTAQNTLGVKDVFAVPAEFLREQLVCVFDDIFPDAVKIGMVADAAKIEVIAQTLQTYHPANIVLDPVMISSSGHALLEETAMDALTKKLFPCVDLLTPNIPEAEYLSGLAITEIQDMEQAARKLSEKYRTAVLLKGGHRTDLAVDVLFYHREFYRYEGERIENPNTHGTGCTLSSAIACNLAMGRDMTEAVRLAKQYLTGAIRAQLDLGAGSGPLEHTYWLECGKKTELFDRI